MTDSRSLGEFHPLYSTIWVKRTDDEKPWCWGGNYDDPSGAESEQRLADLRVEHPSWEWEIRAGSGE